MSFVAAALTTCVLIISCYISLALVFLFIYLLCVVIFIYFPLFFSFDFCYFQMPFTVPKREAISRISISSNKPLNKYWHDKWKAHRWCRFYLPTELDCCTFSFDLTLINSQYDRKSGGIWYPENSREFIRCEAAVERQSIELKCSCWKFPKLS